MIKVVYGNKGVGKTKYLVASANTLVKDCHGDVVFINRSNSLVTDLKHEIRYVDITEFPVSTLNQLGAFICGMIAENYDINTIFVDGLAKYEGNTDEYPQFFEKMKLLSEKFNTRFIFSTSGDISSIPEFVNKEYLLK
jgi:hypothetical protein